MIEIDRFQFDEEKFWGKEINDVCDNNKTFWEELQKSIRLDNKNEKSGVDTQLVGVKKSSHIKSHKGTNN